MKTRQTIRHLPIEQLRAHPGNIRDELGGLEDLALSIREHGILQPLVLTEHPDEPDRFMLLAGHRRLAAAALAGLTSVPCIIRHGLASDDAEQLVVMLVENCQRRDLHPVERAQAYGALKNRGLGATEIARRTGVTPSTVTYYLALLDLDDESLEQVRDGTIRSTDAIDAVREARQQQRQANGAPLRGRPTIAEPGHFNLTHPLAETARQLCTHTGRPKIPKGSALGCGQCWEQAIREDERARILGEPSRAEPSRAEPSRAEPSRAEPRTTRLSSSDASTATGAVA